MATASNFTVKNGLTVGSTSVINSSGVYDINSYNSISIGL